MRIGLAIGGGDGRTVDEMVSVIVQAEKDGFASVWMAQIFSLDALTVLALAGRQTSRIELGTAVIPTYPRHPHSLAQQAVTVNEAAGGRLALGIGRSHQVVIEGMFGLAYDKPIAHMRDYVTVLKGLIESGSVSLDGSAYRVNASLKIKQAPPTPVLIGALRPKMLEVCGTLCDGTLTWMAGPKYIESEIVPRLVEASHAAGRPMPRVVASLPVYVTDDAETAHKTIARVLQVYGQLPVYRACLDAEGVEGPADIALVGDERTVEEGLHRLASAGASDFYALVVPEAVSDKACAQRTHALLSSFSGNL